MSKIFSNLLSRLNGVFSKAPQALSAFQINVPSDSTLIIKDLNFSIYPVGYDVPTLSIDLHDPTDDARCISISKLCNIITTTYPSIAIKNINIAASGLGSIALIDGTYSLTGGTLNNVNFATSILWAIFKPLSLVLKQVRTDVSSAIQQLGFATSSDIFLDYWGEIFGISRFTGEPDFEYSVRLLWETIKPRLNNKAIEQIINSSTGFDATVIDLFEKNLIGDGFPDPIHLEPSNMFTDNLMVGDGYINNTTIGESNDTVRYGYGAQYVLGSIGIYLNIPLTTSYYQYTEEQIEQIVARHRAAGTSPYFTVVQVANELVGIISSLVESIETAIEQSIPEDRVMFFGHDDFTFYGDHWSASSVQVEPWYQNNLDIPSLGDNVILQSQQQTIPAVIGQNISSYFKDSYLGDGFHGDFIKNLIIGDGAGDGDYFANLINIANEFIISNSTTKYVYSPVILNYTRYADEPFIPRIEETLGDDTITVTLDGVSGPIQSLSGTSSKANTSTSSTISYTTPIILVSPVSVTGLKINAIQLQQQNIHNLPVYIPNVNIENFGTDWNTTYSVTRNWLIPYQDAYGNLFYEQIQLPALLPPPVENLKISNPTTTIAATDVLVLYNTNVTISWSVTNAANADFISLDLKTNVQTTTPITYEGEITFYNLVDNYQYTISVNGNNGQTASSSVIVTVVQDSVTASAPTITMSALPDVCNLCSTNTSIITYQVLFNSKQTEVQTITFPENETSLTFYPQSNDPADTIFINDISCEAALDSTGAIVQGGFTGFGTGTLVFTPMNPQIVQGQVIQIAYDVNYGGCNLFFNDTQISIDPDTYEITQQVTVELPDPPSVNGVPAVDYTADYTVKALNYASTSTQTIPIYIQSIQESDGALAITSISPTSIVEAIGNTINETLSITLTGQGFSSNMQVYLLNPISNGNGTYTAQYVEAYLTSLDWINNILVFIAPRFTYGKYQIIVQKSDCEGNVIDSDDSRYLVYNQSTYRDPPVITSLENNVVCIGSSFVSSNVTVNGNNFRAGATVYIVEADESLVSQTTVVLNENSLYFTMDFSVIGNYDIVIVNVDESSCATNATPLELISPTTKPDIIQFNCVSPLDTNGYAYYGANFNIYWETLYTSEIQFLSSDINVQNALNQLWGTTGYVSTPVYKQYTTITLVATNPCGNVSSQVIEISLPPTINITGIIVSPDPIIISGNNPVIVPVFEVVQPSDITQSSYTIEISGNTDISYSYSSNYFSLTKNVISPISSGSGQILVGWNGYYYNATVSVRLPYVTSISVIPEIIDTPAINTYQQLLVTAIYSDGTEANITYECAYADYDSTVVNVSPTGLMYCVSFGFTIITCMYEGYSTYVQVGILDPALVVNSIAVSPAYSLPSLNSYIVRFQVTGANPQDVSYYTNGNNIATFSYTPSNTGEDIVTAYVDSFDITSNSTTIDWVNFNYPIGVASVYGEFFVGNGNGTFSSQPTQSPVFAMSLYSLSFDCPAQSLIPNYPFAAGDETKPMQNAILDSNGNCIGTVSMQGNGYQTGVGALSTFDAVFTGQLIVKTPGNITITLFSDDGYIFGIGNGAQRISGDYINAPYSGTTNFEKYPVMGANNQRQTGGDFVPSSFTVYFPQAGLYDYEIDYSTANDDHLTLFVMADVLGGKTLPPASVSAVVSPNIQQTNDNGVSLALSPSAGIINFIGNTQTFNASIQGNLSNINNSNVGLSIYANNVEYLTINNTPIFNGNIETFDDTINYNITQTTEFITYISNNGGNLTLYNYANVLSFPSVSLYNLQVYEASNTQNITDGAINYINLSSYGVVGLIWNTQYASRVVIYDSINSVSYDVSDSGNKYITCNTSGYFTISVYGINGSYGTYSVYVNIGTTTTITIPNTNTTVINGQVVTMNLPYNLSAASCSLDRVYNNQNILNGTIPVLGGIQSNLSIPWVGLINSNSIFQFIYSEYTPVTIESADSSDTIFSSGGAGSGLAGGPVATPILSKIGTTVVSVYYAAVNYDPGPIINYLYISANNIQVGQPVTISYQTENAIKVTGDFVNNNSLCIGISSFVVYPDRTTTFTLTAYSETGLKTSAQVQIQVQPQSYNVSYSNLPSPLVDYIAINGILSTSSNSAYLYQQNETNIVEIYGNHFLSDRSPNPDILSKVQILIEPSGSMAYVVGLDSIVINSISNTYIQLQMNSYSYTNPGIYSLYVLNDIGLSSVTNSYAQFIVKPIVPEFVMLPVLSAFSGENLDVYLDYVDSQRDVNLSLILNNVNYYPSFIGSNQTDSDFITTLFQQVLSRNPVTSELNNYLNLLSTGEYNRMAVYASIFGLPGANISAITTAGTKVTIVLNTVTTGGLTVHTNNGYGQNSIQLVSEAVPTLPSGSDNLTIQGVNPTYGVPGDTITVFGTFFTENTKLYLGSTLLDTTFISERGLSFIVPAASNSYKASILASDSGNTDLYQYFSVVYSDPYTNEQMVINTLFDTVDIDDITTISNPSNGDVGNVGVKGSYLTQPTYVVNLTGLADLTVDTVLPTYGSYTFPSNDYIVGAEFETISINNTIQSNPNVFTLGIVNHIDLSSTTG